MSGNIERYHLVVSGKVQGVGYRANAMREALSLGLVGWVRNLANGSVELVAEGPADALGRLVSWCGRGPQGANVTEVKVLLQEEISRLTFGHFEIRH